MEISFFVQCRALPGPHQPERAGKPPTSTRGLRCWWHPAVLADTPRESEISPGRSFAPQTLCFKGRSSLGEGKASGSPHGRGNSPCSPCVRASCTICSFFFLSLPRWFFPCPNPNKFSFLDKILPAPVLGTGYRYISPYVTGTFSEFEHHLKSELMVYQARINL